MPGGKKLKGGRSSAAYGNKEAKEKKLMQGREIVTRYGKGQMGPVSKVNIKKPTKRGK